LEPWEKVLVDLEAYGEDKHSSMSCTDCHAGEDNIDKETAHTELVSDPSAGGGQCSECHSDVTDTFESSLHATQEGYWTAINARSTPEDHPALEEMFGNHCASCHTTCGDCHVSQPNSVGGGLIEGHVFNETPSMSRNCTACHGSRVGSEYLGKHEDIKADVHFRQGRMNCVDCHTGTEMHGDYTTPEGELPEQRYDGAQLPDCRDCHLAVGAEEDGVQMHQMHSENLSCQTCHSVSYTSCDGCHVAVSEDSGNPFFRTDGTYLTFLIGRNPLQNDERPYEFVPVRHIPVAPASYEYYGEDLLSNFDALPTWAYATPHNIQLNTPQNASCEACHGSPDFFLTEDKVNPGEITANQNVIVVSPPPALGNLASITAVTMPETHMNFSDDCLSCHLSGVESVPQPPADHADYTNEDCGKCHKLP
jgi:thiosulfate/3-mercaptopyruvate sulfurtransferase